MPEKKKYTCLNCGKNLEKGKETPTFPFCSKRCKMIDLGRWFGGEYHISESLPAEETETWSETESES